MRKNQNRKVYQITLDRISRLSLEYIAETEGFPLSHAISKLLLDYMDKNYPDQLADIRKTVVSEQQTE